MPWRPQYEVEEHQQWQLLEIINDDQEADVVESFLSSEKIPVQRKYKGVSHMSKVAGGMNKLGTHLYVPQSRLEEAKEVLQAVRDGVPVVDEEVHWGQDDNNHQYEGANKQLDKMDPFSRMLMVAIIVLVGGMILSVWSILQGF